MIRSEVTWALGLLDASKDRPQKLAYALAKGRMQLKRLAREIEAHRADAYTPDVLEYLRGREALGMEHAAKDESGEMIRERSGVKLRDPAAYTAALQAYDAEHQVVKCAMTAQDKALRDWMSEEVEIAPHAVDASLVPEDLSVEEAELFVLLLAWEG